MEIVGALLAGAFIGSVLGFVGAGGAMLSVPILIYLFNFTPHHASTAALAIVFLAAAAGTIPKFRSQDVLVREALTIWLLGLTTNLGGSILSRHLSDKTITTGFALVLILAASSMLFSPIKGDQKRIPFVILVLVSLVIGLMTGVFGVGGGFLAIPVLVLFFRTPQNKAAGTSLVIIAINSLTAFLAHHSVWHEINWSIPIAIAITAVTVASIASHHSLKIPAPLLRKVFAVLLYIISAFTLIQTYFFVATS
jgi:hypothetical protein